MKAHDRKRLAQRCRTITRPALSCEPVQINAAGQDALKLKTPWRDGTTHLVMGSLEFMQRLAALVSPPSARAAESFEVLGSEQNCCAILGLTRKVNIL